MRIGIRHHIWVNRPLFRISHALFDALELQKWRVPAFAGLTLRTVTTRYVINPETGDFNLDPMLGARWDFDNLGQVETGLPHPMIARVNIHLIMKKRDNDELSDNPYPGDEPTGTTPINVEPIYSYDDVFWNPTAEDGDMIIDEIGQQKPVPMFDPAKHAVDVVKAYADLSPLTSTRLS